MLFDGLNLYTEISQVLTWNNMILWPEDRLPT